MQPGNPDLVDLIRAKIRRDGPVTFAWFMEQSLYHPQFGYYSSGRCQIGRGGDYFTNVSVGPLFGRLVEAQFAEIWEIMGRPSPFVVVEQGAHQGDFAKDLLESARERHADFFAALGYWIVEPFPVLRRRQEETLREFSAKIAWHESLENLPSFQGIHFSNELIDALPVHLVCRDGVSDWREKRVVDSGDDFVFVTAPITDEALRRQVALIPGERDERREAEVNLAALNWMQTVAAKLERGFVLAVDYGYPRADLYSTAHADGTLQVTAQHRRVSSPLAQVGLVDITSHVDWTSVAERAADAGLHLVGFTDQHHFMTGMLALLDARESDRRALQTLMHPEFLGTRFQYLALSKNVSAARLSGFRFARDARKALGLAKTSP